MRCLIPLLALLTSWSFTQNQDSLKIASSQTEDFSQKTRITHQVVDSYLRNQPDSTQKYLDLAKSYALKSKDKRLEDVPMFCLEIYCKTWVGIKKVSKQAKKRFNFTSKSSALGLAAHTKDLWMRW